MQLKKSFEFFLTTLPPSFFLTLKKVEHENLFHQLDLLEQIMINTLFVIYKKMFFLSPTIYFPQISKILWIPVLFLSRFSSELPYPQSQLFTQIVMVLPVIFNAFFQLLLIGQIIFI